MTVWTSGDICKRYRITRSNFAYWRRQADFPKPLTYAKNTGGTWDSDLVRAWVTGFRAGDPEKRTKRMGVITQFKRGATVSACARNAGVDRKTVRRWLRAAGVMALMLAALAAPAQAGQDLTVREAAAASKATAETTLGPLLYRSVGTAPVTVGACHVHAARGVCRVRISGTSSCSYLSHVLELPGDYFAWGTSLRCR